MRASIVVCLLLSACASLRGKPRGPGDDTRTPEQILKVSPELRRLREKFGGKDLKGGIG